MKYSSRPIEETEEPFYWPSSQSSPSRILKSELEFEEPFFSPFAQSSPSRTPEFAPPMDKIESPSQLQHSSTRDNWDEFEDESQPQHSCTDAENYPSEDPTHINV